MKPADHYRRICKLRLAVLLPVILMWTVFPASGETAEPTPRITPLHTSNPAGSAAKSAPPAQTESYDGDPWNAKKEIRLDEPIRGVIEDFQDADYYYLLTGNAKGVLYFELQQTEPSYISPEVKIYRWDHLMVFNQFNKAKGAGIKGKITMDGQSPVYFIGVMDYENNNKSPDVEYILTVDYDGDLPVPKNFAIPQKMDGKMAKQEQEPNDSPEKPQPFTPGDIISGAIGKKGDVDCFVFELPKGKENLVEVLVEQQGPSDIEPRFVFYYHTGQYAGKAEFPAPGADFAFRLNFPASAPRIIVAFQAMKKEQTSAVPYLLQVKVIPSDQALYYGHRKR